MIASWVKDTFCNSAEADIRGLAEEVGGILFNLVPMAGSWTGINEFAVLIWRINSPKLLARCEGIPPS